MKINKDKQLKILALALLTELNKRTGYRMDIDEIIDIQFENNRDNFIVLRIIWRTTKGIVYHNNWIILREDLNEKM